MLLESLNVPLSNVNSTDGYIKQQDSAHFNFFFPSSTDRGCEIKSSLRGCQMLTGQVKLFQLFSGCR